MTGCQDMHSGKPLSHPGMSRRHFLLQLTWGMHHFMSSRRPPATHIGLLHHARKRAGGRNRRAVPVAAMYSAFSASSCRALLMQVATWDASLTLPPALFSSSCMRL